MGDEFIVREPDPTDPPLALQIGIDDTGKFVVSVTLGAAFSPTQGAVALLRTASKLMRAHADLGGNVSEPLCHYAEILAPAVESIADLITVRGQEEHSK